MVTSGGGSGLKFFKIILFHFIMAPRLKYKNRTVDQWRRLESESFKNNFISTWNRGLTPIFQQLSAIILLAITRTMQACHLYIG